MAFRLVNRDRLLKPNKCLVCERKPQGRVVDTGHNLNRGTVSELLRGRKYICDRCGQLIAKALGFVSHKQVNELKEETIRLQNDVASLRDQVDLQQIMEKVAKQLPAVSDAPVEKQE